LADLKETVEKHLRIEKEIKDLKELFAIAGNDFGFFVELEKKAVDLEKTIGQEELKVFLSGKYDTNNALLSIMAGAGGQDSEDWATLLLRMYQRYGDRQGWRTRILEQSFGEAGGPEGRIGTKSVTLEVKGKYAYGFLRGEAGVHRLVRLSPFSSQALRHTSFAKVEVMPEIEDEKAIEIRPEDLRIDFYRASGPGGQNVNKRETSVRITHLPTAIVVACQVERSQGDNRKKAMAMLASRLIQLKEGKRETEIKKIGGDRVSASWGNQIRSYVLHPYKMVKDLRTEVESSNPDDVLDGNLDKFITAELKIKK
jgi:peptide chain release factor 2